VAQVHTLYPHLRQEKATPAPQTTTHLLSVFSSSSANIRIISEKTKTLPHNLYAEETFLT
jgi:hypothetical protein